VEYLKVFENASTVTPWAWSDSAARRPRLTFSRALKHPSISEALRPALKSPVVPRPADRECRDLCRLGRDTGRTHGLLCGGGRLSVAQERVAPAWLWSRSEPGRSRCVLRCVGTWQLESFHTNLRRGNFCRGSRARHRAARERSDTRTDRRLANGFSDPLATRSQARPPLRLPRL